MRDFAEDGIRLEDWATKLNLPAYRAQILAGTAAVYGVTLPAFIEGYMYVYQGNGNELNKIPENLSYVMRHRPNQTSGFNFPAAMHKLPKLMDIDINNSFIWTLLAFKYNISLEDIVDIATVHDFRVVAGMLSAGHSVDYVRGILDNDIDPALAGNLAGVTHAV